MHDYFSDYYTPPPLKALIVLRYDSVRTAFNQFTTNNAVVVVVGEEIPVNQYDYIFLTFEPTSVRELSWYHMVLKPCVAANTTFVEFGSAK